MSVTEPNDDDPLAVCDPMQSSLETNEDYLSAAAAFSSNIGANAATAAATVVANKRPSITSNPGNAIISSDEQNYASVSFIYLFFILLAIFICIIVCELFLLLYFCYNFKQIIFFVWRSLYGFLLLFFTFIHFRILFFRFLLIISWKFPLKNLLCYI